jgi:hypothetical protein
MTGVPPPAMVIDAARHDKSKLLIGTITRADRARGQP